MKHRFNVLLAAAFLSGGASGFAMAASDAQAGAKGSAVAASTAAVKLTAGEVRKVDADQGKLTIKHGPIENLDMPAMTMVFKAEANLLKGVNAGDKILFRAEQRETGFTVVKLEPAK